VVPNVQRVNPFKCVMWHMHDRLGDYITAETCAALIDSIRKHGQKHPVLGRPICERSGSIVEIIYGARRLFAAQHLKIDLLVDLRDIDDRSALAEMDIENRVRTDITPYERGLSYMRWMRAGYFQSQSELSRSLGISEAQISRLLRYAELPAIILAAFETPHEIREEWAVSLARSCRDPELREVLVRRARSISKWTRPKDARSVYAALEDGKPRRASSRERDEIIRSSNGVPIFRIAFRNNTIHFILRKQDITTQRLAEITEKVREAFSPGAGEKRDGKHDPRVTVADNLLGG
jgi:ParB family transcriptional regulator, chromosome partitioning protein